LAFAAAARASLVVSAILSSVFSIADRSSGLDFQLFEFFIELCGVGALGFLR
jgi:hypothetical protein